MWTKPEIGPFSSMDLPINDKELAALVIAVTFGCEIAQEPFSAQHAG